MIARQELAERIADGVAGQLQWLAAQQMLAMCDESVVQLATASVAHATRDFRVTACAQPANWEDGRRVDIALRPTGEDAVTWYGVVETKYVSSSYIAQNVRLPMIQDCARLAAVETANLNAKFFVVAFVEGMLAKVFVNPHQDAVEAESGRELLAGLLSIALPDAGKTLPHSQIDAAFPQYQSRVPEAHRWSDRGLRAELLVRRDFFGMGETLGTVCVWQINKPPGPGIGVVEG